MQEPAHYYTFCAFIQSVCDVQPCDCSRGQTKDTSQHLAHTTHKGTGSQGFSYRATSSLTTPLWHDVVADPAPCLNIVSVPAQASGLFRPAFSRYGDQELTSSGPGLLRLVSKKNAGNPLAISMALAVIQHTVAWIAVGLKSLCYSRAAKYVKLVKLESRRTA